MKGTPQPVRTYHLISAGVFKSVGKDVDRAPPKSDSDTKKASNPDPEKVNE